MLLILVLILGVCINYSNHAALTNQELKKYKNLIEGQGLYSVEDDVYILTASNIKKQLYGKPHGNLVEFYNSWCGFCQRFQPSWTALATDMKDWRDRLVISAMDCSDDDNAPICREFDIMAYPTLRYFHENYPDEPGKIGDEILKGLDMPGHKTLLLKHIVQEQQAGRAQMLSNIIPYASHNLSDIYHNISSNIQYVFFLAGPEAENLGAEIAIDLQKIDSVAVKYVLTNNSEILKLVSPGVTAFNRQGNEKPVVLDVVAPLTRRNVLTAVKDFLQPRNILIPVSSNQKNVFTGKWNDAKVPNSDDLQQAREKLALRHKIMKMGDVVFQGDLETALRYSLRREIPMSKTITGEKYAALQKYLAVLVKYFPFGKKGREFLHDLVDKVATSEGNLDGKIFAAAVHEAEKPDAHVFSSGIQWLACEGSLPSFRGYPCGLWKLFHYLTVAASEYNNNNDQANPLEVLDAMLGYIRYFFGCSDCSKHFQDMAEEMDMKGVTSLDSSILWLWMAHNSANKRLSGDGTEDPEYLKVQFPSSENCPTCRTLDKKWALPEVLRYLKTVYSNINVRYIGSDTRVLHLGLEDNSNVYSDSSSLFKQLDTSMLFILYFISFLLIVILIRLFLKRRRYIKKIYVHDLLGKV